MAHPSAKARLVNELSRSRTSSPRVDDWATANSFDLHNDQIINSTVNMGNNMAQQPLPAGLDQHREDELSEGRSDGSADMSLEMGRGVKRAARDHDADVSSNMIFSLANDSQYEVIATPPSCPQATSRKSDDAMKRQTSTRRPTVLAMNTEEQRRTASGIKHRTLSETLAKLHAETDSSFVLGDHAQSTTTNDARNTRFARSRQVSATEPAQASRFTTTRGIDDTPRRRAVNNPTVQSATYTANSFILPNLPNITELVSGVRKDGTPVFNRSAKSRSRFTSGMYNGASQQQYHVPMVGVPVPEEEKAIFSSLQLLKDRVGELEMERSEAQKRAEEYEDEIIDLRSQLAMAQRRPDSALGSDEEGSAQEKWRVAKTKLQASVEALQDRLDRSERKISVSEIAVKRVTKERDQLVTQIGVAYYDNEELKGENEAFRDSFRKLQAENEDLKDEMIVLRKENQDLKHRMEKRDETVKEMCGTTREIWDVNCSSENREKRLRSTQSSRAVLQEEPTARRRSAGQVEQEPQGNVAAMIAREVQRLRQEASVITRRTNELGQDHHQRQKTSRSRSKSVHRQQSAGPDRRGATQRRTISAPIRGDMSGGESTTELQITQKTRDTLKSMHLPSPAKTKPREEDTRDITFLSFLDPNEVANLRKKLEEELRAKRENRVVSASAAHTLHDETARSSKYRKSSLKDTTAGLDNGTGRFSIDGQALDDMSKAAKTVRVQSPHTSDASVLPQQEQGETAEISILSNTSRRRRRAASAEEITSAFILPDITLHSSQPPASYNPLNCVKHSASSCTACQPKDPQIPIPTPVPVTDREVPQDVDITSATVRPSQPPPLALATVLKQVEDEIKHLKLQLQIQQRLYSQHDPALSKRKRVLVTSRIERLTAEIEKRSDQVYALYDVLEGQKQAAVEAEKNGKTAKKMDAEEVEDTLMSIGIDPAELTGRIGRKAPVPLGLDDVDDSGGEESAELPWDGLSNSESEEEQMEAAGRQQDKRKAAAL